MTKLQEKIEAAQAKLATAAVTAEADAIKDTLLANEADKEAGADLNAEEGAGLDTEFAAEAATTIIVPTNEPFVQTEKSIHLGNRGKGNPLEGLPMYEPKAGSYKNVRLHSVVLKDGKVVKPNEYGYYESPEGELKDLLAYYAKKGLAELVE